MKKFVTTKLRLSDLAKMRQACVWEGCEASTPIDKDLPPDWRWMIIGWWPIGVFTWDQAERDACLCGKHAALLESYLKDIGNRLKKTEGSA